jgi:hypothetical protein
MRCGVTRGGHTLTVTGKRVTRSVDALAPRLVRISPKEESTMSVTRIDQIAIAVNDLDATLELFNRAFGLTPVSREVVA